jgi:5-methylcytosine-specific restriction endonuclease McrA
MTNSEYKKWQQSGHKTTKQRGYDSAWQKTRAYKLSLAPFCELNRTEGCTKDMPRIATSVDHTIPIRVNPALRLELSNLRSACRRCNNSKRFEDAKRYAITTLTNPPLAGPITF